jgi:ABC-type multidrug transport system ATPase subunit
MVGGLFVRGISGGERKRVCIALEILTDPSILFFDEPTSGLDSTIALRIIDIAKSLSKNGMTVVMAIHQPSSRLYEKFDKLMLLSEGHCTYLGQAQHAMHYFHVLGFKPLIEMNPPEFFLDLCSGNVSGIQTPEDLKGQNRKNSQSENGDHSNDDGVNDKEGRQVEDPDDSKHLNNECLNGEEGRKSVREYLISAYISKARADEVTEINDKSNYKRAQSGASWLTQFQVLAVRDFRERRHEYLNMTRFVELIAIAIVSGFLWFKSNFSIDSELGDQVGLIFYIVMLWGIFPLFQAIYVFPQERAMLAKDRANDMYSLSSYFMARSLVDVPLDLAMPSLFILILAPMAGMRGPASIFFVRLLAIYLIVLTSQGLGLLIGALVMDAKKANSLATVILIAYVLTGGVFVQNIPKFISWLKYLSYQYYGFNLLMKIEYTPDMVYDCSPHGCDTLGKSPVLHGLNLDGGSTEALSLFAMSIGYRFLAYLVLRFQKPSPPN